jgi:tripartite-type tricarboxylate transporter receptor subunit TctC
MPQAPAGRVLRGLIFSSCIASFAAIATTPASGQDSVSGFYQAKTITILIGHPPGGSYDLYARLAAAHMQKHIPGRPNIIVQSKPGGSGVVGVSFFYSNAPKDGTMMGLFPETIAHTQLTEPKVGTWKMQELAYVGSFANVNAVFMMRKGSPAQTLEDMRSIKTNVGCSGRIGQSYINPALLKAFGGYKFEIICGYPGSNDYPIALARGEVDLVSSAWNNWSRRSDVLDGSLRPVIQSGLQRHKDLKDIPLMQDLLDNPQHKKVAEFLSSGSAIGRALLVPKAIPSERLDTLRKAFDAVVLDPAFIADSTRASAELDPTSGIEVQKISDDILATPKDIIELAIDAGK